MREGRVAKEQRSAPTIRPLDDWWRVARRAASSLPPHPSVGGQPVVDLGSSIESVCGTGVRGDYVSLFRAAMTILSKSSSCRKG